MHIFAKGIWGAALAAALAPAALADDPGPANIAVQGNAPAVCSLGGWTKDSGAGAFTGGTNAVVTYSDSEMVDGAAMATLGPAQAVVLRASLVCNTGLTWTIAADKGALRNDAGVTPPAGFANQWLYNLVAGPKTPGGAWVGYLHVVYDSDGTPIGGISATLTPSLSQTIGYFSLTFTPIAQSARMLAGNYSERITLTVEPSL